MISPKQFGNWAKRDIPRWKQLEGHVVRHRVLGWGKLSKAYRNANGIILEVAFSHEDRKSFLAALFGVGFTDIRGDINIRTPDIKSALDLIKEKVKKGELLTDDEIRSLGVEKYVDTLNEYLKLHGTDWPIAKVSSFWRKASLPEKALKVTEAIETGDNFSAKQTPIWITRAAAFLDVYEITADVQFWRDAKRCTENAERSNGKSSYLYRLQARLAGMEGDSESAKEYYDLADGLP